MGEKILIVDDDVETLRLVGLMLQGQGYQIIAATSGSQAITLTRNEDPDLILLDIMMPDMDGIEVARRLRSLPAVLDIPILMFTARSQAADRIAGYEAGADDYLTKPVHPKLLLTHVKDLLGRMRRAAEPAAPTARGQVVAVMAARGGLGASTLALNLGACIARRGQGEVILAELRPGRGTLAPALGLPPADGLARLLREDAGRITPATVERELVRCPSGLRLLPAAGTPEEAALAGAAAQMGAILAGLAGLADFVVADLGDGLNPGFERLAGLIRQAVVVVDGDPVTLQRTRGLLERLRGLGFGVSRPLRLALVQRTRYGAHLSWSQVAEALGAPVAQVISPFPELTYQASLRATPVVTLQPAGMAAAQFEALATQILEAVPAP